MSYFQSILLLLLLVVACGEPTPETEDHSPLVPSGDPGIDQISARIQANPLQADLYASRAQMEYERNNYDGAIADLQQAIAIDSTQLGYYYLLSDVYLDYFRSRYAIEVLESAVELDRDQSESWLRLGEAQLVTKQYDDAIASLNEVVRVDRRNPDAFMLLGQVFVETGDTVQAIQATQEAVEIEPDLIDGWIKLGQLYADRGSNRAEDYFQTARELDSTDVIAISALADYYWTHADRSDDALELYRTAARLDRQYVKANFNAGLLLMEQGRVEEAREEFSIVISNDPLHIRSHFYRGYANEQLGRIDEARNDYRNALRLAPEYELALEGLARIGK